MKLPSSKLVRPHATHTSNKGTYLMTASKQYHCSNESIGEQIQELVAGLLGVESGQDAVIRALLYERAVMEVKPYGISVAEFTDHISELRNKLGKMALKDEGLIVPRGQGAERILKGNVLAGDSYSISYERTPEEILRIFYGGGNESRPGGGGFYPKGVMIALLHLIYFSRARKERKFSI